MTPIERAGIAGPWTVLLCHLAGAAGPPRVLVLLGIVVFGVATGINAMAAARDWLSRRGGR